MKKIIVGILIFASWAQASVIDTETDTYNFRFSPIHALIGYANLNLDVAISPEWTLGPSVGIWNFNSSSLSDTPSTTSYQYNFFGLGARANWFKNGVYKDGLVIGPHIEFFSLRAKSTTTASDLSGKATATVVGCYVGYGWFWESFNQMLSGGLRSIGKTKITIEDSTGKQVDETNGSGFSSATIEYTLGWTF